MKTINEVMEGVTAGGKWQSELRWLDAGNQHIAYFSTTSYADAAFAARAARSFELMARALERVVKALDSGQPFYHGKDCSAPGAGGPCDCWVRDTKAALAEALKDS